MFSPVLSVRCRMAFTLVEMLVAVAVVALLAALAVPALQRALDAVRAAKCVSNQHQIGTAMLTYAAQNEGWLPPLTDTNGQEWDATLSYMLHGSYDARPSWVLCAKNGERYGYNNLIGSLTVSGAANPYRRLLLIVRPADKVLIGCVESGNSISLNVPAGSFNKMALIHRGKAMVLFVDGHIAPGADGDFTSYTYNFHPEK